jgi:signal transduction histidine kinase
MARYRLRRYLGIVFIGAVIAPAVILSFLAIRAISHEEAYIEKQIEGTLAAEVAHVSGMVKAELTDIQEELDGTVVIPDGNDPSQPFAQWRQRSALVEIPFLLSSDYSILWPVAASQRETGEPHADAGGPGGDLGAESARAENEVESAFLLEQQAFLTGEEKTPVYENIAVAYKDDILGDEAGVPGRIGDSTSGHPAQPGEVSAAASRESGQGARKQSAISRFAQSPSVQEKVYDKAELEGQNILYRNVEITDAVTEAESPTQGQKGRGREAVTPSTKPEAKDKTDLTGTSDERTSAAAKTEGRGKPEPAAPKARRDRPRMVTETTLEPEAAGRIRSIFISEPLSLSEIVAVGRSGIIPRFIAGRLELLYWRRTAGGEIVGCLIDSAELRERVIGILPGIYSTVRILTVLDELGRPLIVPPGHEGRDWKRPFVAQEISEMLPRWEIAAYLTDPDVISARAQVATWVMWILILIVFVSLTVGGVLVIRSTSAEMRLAQQKTTFVANVSHELKTPLTSIRMFAEMLRDGHQPDTQKQKQYLDIMAAETERLTRLVNNVLDFSRMERGEKRYSMKAVDLIALCSAVVESQRARFESNGFRVTFTTHTAALPVRADEEAIKQALINLLSNAEKYSTDRKEIDIEVDSDAGRAAISVSDRGVGIPPGEADRIFDEFFRVDDKLTSKVKGAGLGLTIARRILKDHDGDIRYRAREGGGSTFELILPTAEDTA